MKRWSNKRLEEVKRYLETRTADTLTRQDRRLMIEYLAQRYSFADSGMTERQWRTSLKKICRKMEWRIENPDAHIPPYQEDPAFAKKLDEILGKK